MAAARTRIGNVLLALVLITLLAIVLMLATGVRGGPLDPGGAPGSTPGVRLPGTPISQADIPLVIDQPGLYYLTEDVYAPGALTAITINTLWVTLDLGGFAITGDMTPNSVGIGASAIGDEVAIRNGTVRQFYLGIDVSQSLGAQLQGVTVETITARGIVLGHVAHLEDCSVSGTGEGIWVEGRYSTISDCALSYNSLNGVVLFDGDNIVENSEFHNNATDPQFSDTASVRVLGAGNIVRGNNLNQPDFDMYITGVNTLVKENASTCPFVIKDSTGTTDYFGNDCLSVIP